MFEFLANVLAFFYDIWPGTGSYAGAIALFTMAIMLVLTPLSIKTTRSMIAMQRVAPELKKLQQKHKNDREALNREMMAFYQENNINPFASCLPLLLQMPVFFALYRVLIGLTNRGEDGTFEPAYLAADDSLAQALRGSSDMMSMGMDLSRGALDVLQNDGLVPGLPFVVLVAAVVLTAFVQQRQIQGRNPDAAINPQQQMIGKILPFIFIPISVSIPAGVVIYFVVSNLVRIGQQALVTQLEYSPKAQAKRDAAAKAKPESTIDVESSEKDAKEGKGNKRQVGSGDSSGSSRSSKQDRSKAGSGSGNGSNGSRPTGSNRPAATSRTGGSQSRNRKKKKRK
jgi:YidC/Oxa1 family membrane protein insertase